MGRELQVDVSDAFVGAATAQWLAVSDDRTIAEADALTGATVALTGVATGATTVRVVAFNAGGLATADVAVTVVEPTPPAITATAPTHCLTGEGTPTSVGNNTGREGIATVAVAYTAHRRRRALHHHQRRQQHLHHQPHRHHQRHLRPPRHRHPQRRPDVNVVESGPKPSP